MSTPVISNLKLSAKSGTVNVSGVGIVSTGTIFALSTIISSFAQYYYVNPPLIYSSLAIGDYTTKFQPSAESSIVNITNGFSTNQLSGPVTFVNSSISLSSLSSLYASTITYSAVAYNVAGSSIGYTSSILAMIDGPTVALINRLPTSPCTIGYAAKETGNSSIDVSSPTYAQLGCRWRSYPQISTPSTFTPPAPTSGNSFWALVSTVFSSYGSYDDSASIVAAYPALTATDLQISNGCFTAPANTSTPYAYIDYTRFGQSFNYSGITATSTINNMRVYRYTTWAWAINSSAKYTTVTFIINGASNLYAGRATGFPGGIGITYNEDSGSYASPITMYYRTVTLARSIPTNTGARSSGWINFNINTNDNNLSNPKWGPAATSANIFRSTSNVYTTISALAPFQSVSTSITITPAFFWPGGTSGYSSGDYLLLKIGIPLAATASYESVSALIY
jgi:hypothetical protein